MGLEIVNGLFGSAAAVGVRGNKLVLNFPVFFYYAAKFLADIVFEHLVFNGLDTVIEAGNDAFVGVDMVVVVLGLGGFDKEDVAFTVVGKHDILVASAGADREATHVSIVHISGGKDLDMEFVDAMLGSGLEIGLAEVGGG